MHEHRIPMRWADIDSLDHVNNVAYLAYAGEALTAMVASGELAEYLTPATTTVRFVRPLRLGRLPVVVASAVEGETLVQQIAVDGHDGRTVHAEVTTRTGDRTPAAPREGVTTSPMSLRRADLDDRGLVTTTKVFELFQETRVLHLTGSLTAMRPGRFVVGTSSVTFHDDLTWGSEPLSAASWISRVGTGSFDMTAELSNGDAVLAASTTTLVGFDPESQTAKAFDDVERQQLRDQVPAAAS